MWLRVTSPLLCASQALPVGKLPKLTASGSLVPGHDTTLLVWHIKKTMCRQSNSLVHRSHKYHSLSAFESHACIPPPLQPSSTAFTAWSAKAFRYDWWLSAIVAQLCHHASGYFVALFTSSFTAASICACFTRPVICHMHMLEQQHQVFGVQSVGRFGEQQPGRGTNHAGCWYASVTGGSLPRAFFGHRGCLPQQCCGHQVPGYVIHKTV